MQPMTRDEFELRFTAYRGMKIRFRLERDTDTLVNLTKITSSWQLQNALTETSPEDLKVFTQQTYTAFKLDFISQNKTKKAGTDDRFSLADYIERLEYELKVIKEMGFNSYFLIVSDYVRRAKANQISVWPWRWSWAGSVLAWFIGITEMDPLPFDLLFERFLNPARVSMPDFDIDFEDTLRWQVVQYVTEKYGSENVCFIWTFMKMAWKAAFKDSARALWIPFDKSNYISNLIPDKIWLLDLVTKTPADENQEIKRLYETDEKVKQAIDYWNALTWNMRQLWVHACWIIIAPQPVTNFTPTQFNKESDHTIVSQYDWPTLEKIWLLKMDFLWLRNLSIIKNCIKIIKARADKNGTQIPANLQDFLDTMSLDLPLDDAQSFNSVFKTGETTGIFQFESAGMRRYLIELEPDNINNIIAMVALYRPWPMDYIPSYIARRLQKETIEYLPSDLEKELLAKYWPDTVVSERQKLIQDLDSIMKDTYGIAVYQEQLMFLVQSMAGFSLGEADMLRRWIWKKKKEVIEQLKAEFIQKWASFRDYKPETTKYIYEHMIEPAANYSFNKSHAACYALIAYQTAYLKAHYPIEFHAALIRSVEEDVDTQSFYISEIQSRGIQLFWPDINESYNHVAAIDNFIRMGFISIKWVGFEVWETIQTERQKNWKFTTLEDFFKRCSSIINKKSLEWLIKSWALDAFADRNVLRNSIDDIQNRIKYSANVDQGFFWGLESLIPLKKLPPADHMQKLMMEQEVFKTFVSWNPLDWFYKYAKKRTFISQIHSKPEYPYFEIIAYIKEIRKAKKKWFFIKIADITSEFEFFMTNLCGLERFDLIILSWTKKSREVKDWPKKWEKKSRISISKIIKTTYNKLKSLAGSSFDPADTVIQVMKTRAWELAPPVILPDNTTINPIIQPEIVAEFWDFGEEIIDTDYNQDNQPDNIDNLDSPDFSSDNWPIPEPSLDQINENCRCDLPSEQQDPEPLTSDSSKSLTLDFSHLPSHQLPEIIQLIKENPWPNQIIVLGNQKLVSDYALQQLQNFVL